VTALPTVKAGGTAVAAPSPVGYAGSGGCIFNGGNQTGVVCGNNTNAAPAPHNIAAGLRVNYTLLICCIVLAFGLVMVRGDTSVGGCIYNGGNQNNSGCNGNQVHVEKSAAIKSIQLPVLQLTAVMSFFLCIGFVMADDIIGGCKYDGGTQNNSPCGNNTVVTNPTIFPAPAPSEQTHGLSAGERAGIIVGCVAVGIALIPAGATLVNPNTIIAEKGLWEYRRAVLYKFVEGCTFGFMCDCLNGLRERMAKVVENGGFWSWSKHNITKPSVATEGDGQ
jgi:hypothetical protein